MEDSDDLTLAMGLVRGTRLRIACDNRLWLEYPGDESSQSLREFTYRYAFMPHTDKWEKAKLYDSALAFAAPLKVCQFGKQKGIFDTDKSFVQIEGDNLVLSSVTKLENGTVLVRLYNPTDKEIKGKLNIGFDFDKARSIRLDGKEIESLKKDKNSEEIKVGKGKIYTVEVM